MNRQYLRYSALALVALGAVSCGGDLYEGSLLIMGVFGILGLVGGIFGIVANNDEKRERERKRQEWQAKMKAEKEERVKAYESGLATLRSELGDADKTIIIGECDLDNEIRVYPGRNAITILGKTYDFKAILSCSCTDDYAVSRGDAAIKADGHTSTDTGGMIGRAVVGGLIAGEAGAIIGGATAGSSASMTGTIKYGDDKILHNYTVWVTVRDIAAPTIEIHTGADSRLTNEVVSLMNVIIEANKA